MNDINKPENKDMTRKEDLTRAATPDKLDRSMRDEEIKTGDGRLKPYPPTEEEATPKTPRSEEISLSARRRKTTPRRRSNSSNDNKKNETGKVASDYNKHISHPQKR